MDPRCLHVRCARPANVAACLASAIVALCSLPVPAQADPSTDKPLPGPKYAPIRADDDFSYLDGEEGSYQPDFFDPIKRIHLGDDLTMSLGGETRAIEAVHDAPVPVAEVDIAVSPGFGVAAGTADGDYLPIVKVAPVYPQRAIDRGIEGYVIVEFTVTKTGAVRDPKVVEYHPSTIFNKAAIDAALKFKYKPRVVNGEPIEVHGVLNKITFKLED